MFFVDATALLVVVVLFAVSGWIVPLVVGTAPRVEGFSEFLKNPLTGLTVQSLVFLMGLQLVFQLLVVGYLARLLPDVSGVVVGDVPELAG
jgi:hypothetical protein